MHVDGSNRGIATLDLSSVLGTGEEQDALVAIKSLDLSGNELRELRDLAPMASLIALNGSFNRIETVVHLPGSLVKLNLSHNHIDDLGQFASLPSLADLNVSSNRLTTLHGCPTGLVNLCVAHNHLQSLDGVEACTVLEHLDAGHTRIDRSDGVRPIRHLQALRVLSLLGAPLSRTGGYRRHVAGMCPSLIELDGTQCVLETNPDGSLNNTSSGPLATPTDEPETTAMPSRRRKSLSKPSSSSAIAGHETVAMNNDTSPKRKRPGSVRPSPAVLDSSIRSGRGSAAYDSVLQHRQERAASVHDLRQQREREMQDIEEELQRANHEVHRLQVLLHEEQGSNQRLAKRVRQMETIASDNKRVLSDELQQVLTLREVNARLSTEITTLRAKLDKATRDVRYARERAAKAEGGVVSRMEGKAAEQEERLSKALTEAETAKALQRRAERARDVAIADAARLRKRLASVAAGAGAAPPSPSAEPLELTVRGGASDSDMSRSGTARGPIRSSSASGRPRGRQPYGTRDTSIAAHTDTRPPSSSGRHQTSTLPEVVVHQLSDHHRRQTTPPSGNAAEELARQLHNWVSKEIRQPNEVDGVVSRSASSSPPRETSPLRSTNAGGSPVRTSGGHTSQYAALSYRHPPSPGTRVSPGASAAAFDTSTSPRPAHRSLSALDTTVSPPRSPPRSVHPAAAVSLSSLRGAPASIGTLEQYAIPLPRSNVHARREQPLRVGGPDLSVIAPKGPPAGSVTSGAPGLTATSAASRVDHHRSVLLATARQHGRAGDTSKWRAQEEAIADAKRTLLLSS